MRSLMAPTESERLWFEDEASLAALIGGQKSLSVAPLHPTVVCARTEVLATKAALYFKGQTSVHAPATLLLNIKATKAGL